MFQSRFDFSINAWFCFCLLVLRIILSRLFMTIQTRRGSGVAGGSLNHFIENLTNHDKTDNDFKRVFWACFPMFTASTTVFNKLVERYHVPEALGNPVKNQALTVIASNGFLTGRSTSATSRSSRRPSSSPTSCGTRTSPPGRTQLTGMAT